MYRRGAANSGGSRPFEAALASAGAGKDGAIRHVMSGVKFLHWHIVVDALSGLKLEYPKPTAKRRQELKSIRRILEK